MAVLKKGSKGDEVTKLQEQLVKAGVKPKPKVDGKFGKGTAEAVKAFQTMKKLKPDGVAGKKTLGALGGGGGRNAGGKAGGGSKAGGSKAGGAKSGGGDGGGKGGVKLPKGALQKLNDIKKQLHAHQGDCKAAAGSIAKAQKEFQKQAGMPEPEKTKHMRPIMALFAKTEKSQKNLAATLLKTSGLTSELGKSGDKGAKKLVELAQNMDGAAKKYVAHSKSTGKRGEEFLKRLAKDQMMSTHNIGGRFTEIYLDSTPGRKFINAWTGLYDIAKKAA